MRTGITALLIAALQNSKQFRARRTENGKARPIN